MKVIAFLMFAAMIAYVLYPVLLLIWYAIVKGTNAKPEEDE